jgi:hypothetical protein
MGRKPFQLQAIGRSYPQFFLRPSSQDRDKFVSDSLGRFDYLLEKIPLLSERFVINRPFPGPAGIR